MKQISSMLIIVALLVATPVVAMQQGGTPASGRDDVLRGIPAIAKAFAPIAGVKWQEFAQVLAGICAVESGCSPTYQHISQGKYSQYQGLFQMNVHEVGLAERNLGPMVEKMRQLAQSSPTVDGYNYQEAYEFVRKGIEQANSSQGDKRFLPTYGIIIGAAKHIQINKQLAERYPGDPMRQASGHLTAQFSGITEGKIRNRQFDAMISGSPTQPNTEAWALGLNQVSGQGLTVAGAIESAGTRYATKMRDMIQRMSSLTNDLSLVPPNVPAFTAPPYQPGNGPLLSVHHSGVSAMMLGGLIPPSLAPATPYSPGVPASIMNAAQPIQPASPSQPGQPGSPNQGNTNGGASTPQSAMRILVQPYSVRPGGSALLAWTSVGMRSGSCVLRKQGTADTISSASAGARLIYAPTDSAYQTITFEFRCQSPSGETVVTEASVGIQ